MDETSKTQTIDLKLEHTYKTAIVFPHRNDYSGLDEINIDGNWVHVSSTPVDAHGEGAVCFLFTRQNITALEI